MNFYASYSMGAGWVTIIPVEWRRKWIENSRKDKMWFKCTLRFCASKFHIAKFDQKNVYSKKIHSRAAFCARLAFNKYRINFIANFLSMNWIWFWSGRGYSGFDEMKLISVFNCSSPQNWTAKSSWVARIRNEWCTSGVCWNILWGVKIFGTNCNNNLTKEN